MAQRQEIWHAAFAHRTLLALGVIEFEVAGVPGVEGEVLGDLLFDVGFEQKRFHCLRSLNSSFNFRYNQLHRIVSWRLICPSAAAKRARISGVIGARVILTRRRILCSFIVPSERPSI